MGMILTRQKVVDWISIVVRLLDSFIKDGKIRAFKPYNGKPVFVFSDSISEADLKSTVPAYGNFEDDQIY